MAVWTLLISGSVLSGQQSERRWLVPDQELQHLPSDRDILFWKGQEQISGFRNLSLLGPYRTIPAGAPTPLPSDPDPLTSIPYEVEGVAFDLEDFLLQTHVAGLLVLKEGAVVLERYGLGNRPDHRWVSFSVTKSIVSILVGAAIQDGYLEGVDSPVTDFIPLLRGTPYGHVRLQDILQMHSGVAWSEDYDDPSSDVAISPFELLELLQFLRGKSKVAPAGSRYNYNTGETHLVGASLRGAIGNNLAAYLSQKIWQPLGMEQDGHWASHSPQGGELGGCCISASLRDWGRLAQFILNDGVLPDGTRVLPEGWLHESTQPSPTQPGYGYLWWLEGSGAFRASGIFGQAIYLNPEKNLAIVVQSAWPQAVGRPFSSHRDAFFRGVERALEVRDASLLEPKSPPYFRNP
jgi:CubicO group peptidase (beta-lactamase class C family)